MTLKQVPQLKPKTAHERGPLDPDSLTAAVKWDVIMDPALPVDPIGATQQRPFESKAQVGSLVVPTLGPGPVLGVLKGGQDQGSGQPADPEPASTPEDPGAHLGQALDAAQALL